MAWCVRSLSAGIAFAVPLIAAAYHVSPGGSDSNPGTEMKPFRTIGKAVKAVSPGDVILLEDGTYHSEGHVSDGTGGMHGYATPVAIGKAGRADAWITLRAENKWKAILDCDATQVSPGCDVFVTLKRGADYWSFEDLFVTHAAYAGINTNEGASHVRIKGCKFEDIGNRRESLEIGIVGVGFGPPEATDWQLEDNIFHHIGRTGGHYPSLDHGIYARGSDVVIRNNLFYEMNAGWGIQTSSGARNWIIEHNTFALPNPAAAGQIMLWDGGHPNSVSGIVIRANVFYEPRQFAIATNGSIANCTIKENVTTAKAMVDRPDECNVTGNAVGKDLRFEKSAAGAEEFRLSPDSPGVGSGWDSLLPAAGVGGTQERIR